MITSLSSEAVPDGNSVCMCVSQTFVIFRLLQDECEQYDSDACRPLQCQGMWRLHLIKNLL